MMTFSAVLMSVLLLFAAVDETASLKIDGIPVKAVVSPDGKKIVFAQRDELDKEIFLADRNGLNVKKLTHNRQLDYTPAWSPDGKRIVFCSKRTGIHQIYEMDLDGKNTKQITKAPNGARHPRYSSDGWLAYQFMYPSKGKMQPADLIVQKGDKKLVAIKQTDITDYDWSPDGSSICIGTVNKVNFFDLESRQMTSVDVHKKDKRLFAHGPYEICWAPENDQVACRIRFLGGRVGNTKIFGDDQVFRISIVGKFEVIEQKAIQKSQFEWIKKAFVPELPGIPSKPPLPGRPAPSSSETKVDR